MGPIDNSVQPARIGPHPLLSPSVRSTRFRYQHPELRGNGVTKARTSHDCAHHYGPARDVRFEAPDSWTIAPGSEDCLMVSSDTLPLAKDAAFSLGAALVRQSITSLADLV